MGNKISYLIQKIIKLIPQKTSSKVTIHLPVKDSVKDTRTALNFPEPTVRPPPTNYYKYHYDKERHAWAFQRHTELAEEGYAHSIFWLEQNKIKLEKLAAKAARRAIIDADPVKKEKKRKALQYLRDNYSKDNREW